MTPPAIFRGIGWSWLTGGGVEPHDGGVIGLHGVPDGPAQRQIRNPGMVQCRNMGAGVGTRRELYMYTEVKINNMEQDHTQCNGIEPCHHVWKRATWNMTWIEGGDSATWHDGGLSCRRRCDRRPLQISQQMILIHYWKVLYMLYSIRRKFQGQCFFLAIPMKKWESRVPSTIIIGIGLSYLGKKSDSLL